MRHATAHNTTAGRQRRTLLREQACVAEITGDRNAVSADACARPGSCSATAGVAALADAGSATDAAAAPAGGVAATAAVAAALEVNGGYVTTLPESVRDRFRISPVSCFSLYGLFSKP